MDVNTAVLNGFVEENIFMKQPKVLESEESLKVCKLSRSIYSLKQALRSWIYCIDETVHSYGFLKNEDEPYVYKKVSGS